MSDQQIKQTKLKKWYCNLRLRLKGPHAKNEWLSRWPKNKHLVCGEFASIFEINNKNSAQFEGFFLGTF